LLKKASNNGNPLLVAYLLSNGAQISVDKYGNTPLHDAAISGNIECVRYLIGSSCDPTIKDVTNMTCSDIAESHGHLKFVEEVRKLESLVKIKFEIFIN
jgi:ankyrin repeat protein